MIQALLTEIEYPIIKKVQPVQNKSNTRGEITPLLTPNNPLNRQGALLRLRSTYTLPKTTTPSCSD